MPYNQPAKRPTPPAPINYNYTRTPGPLSADQMIAQQQERMRMQSQQATPRDHMQYQQAAAFNAESMAQMRNMQMGAMMPKMPAPNQPQMGAAGFGTMPQMPFRQYPQFDNAASMPTIPPGYRGNTPYDGIGMNDMEVRSPYRPGVAPMPGMTKRPSPDFGDMTDEDMHAMYQMLSGMGAFDPRNLE